MKKKTKKKDEVNWTRIITLSAAGKYIQERLDEELKKVTPLTKKR